MQLLRPKFNIAIRPYLTLVNTKQKYKSLLRVKRILVAVFNLLNLTTPKKIKTMKKVLLLLMVSCLTAGIYAQEKTAKIEFSSETIDYGEIAKDSDGVRVFTFTNTGDAPLIISNAKGSCGCTVPTWPKDKAIMPGETGEIQVKYDTKRVGPIAKVITVTSNADTPTKVLKIKGKVLAEESK